MNDQEYHRFTHDDIIERLPAFVVGALDPDEMLAVEEYIHAHPELLARVHELELAAARLAYAAPPQPLPQELHAKVMNRARGSLQKLQPVTAPHVERPRAPAVPPQPRENALAAWWRKRGFFDLGLVAAVAAVIALTVLYRGALGELDGLRQQVQGLEQQVATIQDQNRELQDENIRLQSDLDMRLNQLASIGGAQQVVALGGTDAAPGASGTLYVHDTVGTLVLSNLDALAENQTYQLWLIPPDGAPIPAGLLGQAGDSVQTITLDLPTTMDSVAAVGISVEPPGGSAAPTGPIVLLGEKA